MYYRILLFVAVLFIALSCHRGTVASHTPYANTEMKNAKGDTILLGHCALAELQKPRYRQWFQASYNGYTIDSVTVARLQPLLAGKTIEVFLGTWCGDSRREVPRLVKILEAAHFDTAQLRLIFVNNAIDAYKQSPAHEEAGKLIHRVPTIIVYKGKELGRIVESPVASLEKDLLQILSREAYTPHYKAVAYLQQQVAYSRKPFTGERLQELARAIQPLSSGASELSTMGYILMAQKQQVAAMNVYQLNALLYPGVPLVFERLAEGYTATGDTTHARECYEKVLALKPGDANALKQLALLK